MVAGMTVSLSTVHIYVDDPDAALAFYRDTLGLTVSDEVENGGFRWITLATDTQPDIKIVLSQPHAGRSGRGRPRRPACQG
jgi:catechol 2,3-dioxygenase-like lactoylglutathione lyase family enzyme